MPEGESGSNSQREGADLSRGPTWSELQEAATRAWCPGFPGEAARREEVDESAQRHYGAN